MINESMPQNAHRKKAQRRQRNLRFILLLLILAIAAAFGILHQLLPFGKAPVGVDALCPFGAIESAFTLIASGTMLQRIAVSSFILLLAVFLTALLFRRAFCGYICPLGTLQEIFSRLGRTRLKHAFRLPTKIDRPARWIKYIVLVAVVIGSAKTAELIIRPYDPWVAFQHLSSTDLLSEFPWGFAILLVSLIGAIFFNRIFCKYLCPMGAFLAIITPLSYSRVRRNEATCIQCNRCDRICPVDIDVSRKTLITTPECLDCHQCVNVCPVENTLMVENRRHKVIATSVVLGAVMLIFFATIAISTVLNFFEWKTIPLTAKSTDTANFDPEAIRGKMIFADVIAASGVPAEVVMEHFSLKKEELHEAIKDVGLKHDFETEDVRDFLAEYRAGNSVEKQPEKTVDKEVSTFDPQSITGKMTLTEVAQQSGFPLEKLTEHFSIAKTDTNVPLKDLSAKYPFDTQAVRDFIATSINK